MKLALFMIWGEKDEELLKSVREILGIIRDNNDFQAIRTIKNPDGKGDRGSLEDFNEQKESIFTWMINKPYTHWLILTKYNSENDESFDIFIKDGNIKDKIKEIIKNYKSIMNYRITNTKSEVKELLDLFKCDSKYTPYNPKERGKEINGLSYYTRFDHLKTYFPFYCNDESVATHKLVEVNVDELTTGRILSSAGSPLDTSPHYQYLINNKEPYKNYVDQRWNSGNIGVCETVCHGTSRFDTLIRNFNPNTYDFGHIDENGQKRYIIIWNWPNGDKKNQIIDGVHRASMLLLAYRERQRDRKIKCIEIT